MNTKQEETKGYIALILENPNFRYLWFGQIVSLLGDWFNLIASAALIAKLSQSGLAISGLFVIRMLAQFAITPLAGIWADRFNRKTLLILTDLIRAFTVFCFLLVRNPDQVWLLYTLTAIQMAVSGVFFPTRSSILPDVVSYSELGAANALQSATWSIMLALGAALGGLSAGIWGIYPSFVIDGITFLISASLIFQVVYQPKPREHQSGTSLKETITQYVDGLRYIKNQTDILAITLIKPAGSLLIVGAFQVLQVEITEKLFVIGEGGGISLGLIYMMVGIGTGLGPIVFRKFTGDRDRPMRLAIIIGFGIAALGLFLVSTLSSFPIVLLGTLLRGIGIGVNWVFSTQLLLIMIPDQVRGRVFSTEFAMFTLMNAIGASLGGWALDSLFSMNQILLIMGLATLAPAILWGFWIWGKKPKNPSKSIPNHLRLRQASESDLDFLIQIDKNDEGVTHEKAEIWTQDKRFDHMTKISQFVAGDNAAAWIFEDQNSGKLVGGIMVRFRDKFNEEKNEANEFLFKYFDDSIFPSDGRFCEVFQLWVDPAYRRKGLATALKQKAEIESKKRGIKMIYTHTKEENVHVITMNQKLGYREVRRGPIWDSIIRVSLVKNL